MNCFSPILIKTDKSRNTVPCGKCPACLARFRADWVKRLEIEHKYSKSADWVTLTYNEKNYPENGKISKRDIQLFFKVLRKKSETKIKYFAVGEYGENTKRPHYHIVIFNVSGNSNERFKAIDSSWDKGFIKIGDVSIKSIKYTLKYMLKSFKEESSELKPFRLMSKSIGIGYVDNLKDWHKNDITRNFIVVENGAKNRLPRYLRDKIYTKREKEFQNKRAIAESDNLQVNYKTEVDVKERFRDRQEKSRKYNSKF